MIQLNQWMQRARGALTNSGRSQGPDAIGEERGFSWLYWLLGVTGAYLVVAAILTLWWDNEPELLDIELKTRLTLNQTGNESGSPSSAADIAGTTDSGYITGTQTTVALIEVANTLLNKPGGYLSNDILPPGLWMDNVPSWEYGVLTQVRDLSRVMRESYSRSQSQSKEDIALKKTEAQFNFSNSSWMLPPTEDEYETGIKSVRNYLHRLVDESEQSAQFFARSDNLRYWLGTVETRLGSLSQNLSASVGQKRLDTNLAGETAARQSTSTPADLEVKTSWFEIDNVFYEARGSTWALIHFLRAAEVDFAEVLDRKNARVSLQQIIRELEGAQQPLRSPMVLNGGGFGMLANHSLVMANYISRANAAIIDLRELLSRG